MFDSYSAAQALVERHGTAAAADAEDEFHQAGEEPTEQFGGVDVTELAHGVPRASSSDGVERALSSL